MLYPDIVVRVLLIIDLSISWIELILSWIELEATIGSGFGHFALRLGTRDTIVWVKEHVTLPFSAFPCLLAMHQE
jgi:hypothetical protein